MNGSILLKTHAESIKEHVRWIESDISLLKQDVSSLEAQLRKEGLTRPERVALRRRLKDSREKIAALFAIVTRYQAL